MVVLEFKYTFVVQVFRKSFMKSKNISFILHIDEDNEYEPDLYDSMIIPKIDPESKMVMMNITGTTYESGKFKQVDYSCKQNRLSYS